MNRTKNIAHIVSVSLLIAFYIGTIPVLTVFHHHNVGGSSLLAGSRISEEKLPEKDHSLSCAVCFRISTSQAFVGITTIANPALVNHPAYFPPVLTSNDACETRPFQERAPPLHHL